MAPAGASRETVNPSSVPDFPAERDSARLLCLEPEEAAQVGSHVETAFLFSGLQRGECEKGAACCFGVSGSPEGWCDDRPTGRWKGRGGISPLGLLVCCGPEDLEGKEVRTLQLLERQGRQGAFCSGSFVLDCGIK